MGTSCREAEIHRIDTMKRTWPWSLGLALLAPAVLAGCGDEAAKPRRCREDRPPAPRRPRRHAAGRRHQVADAASTRLGSTGRRIGGRVRPSRALVPGQDGWHPDCLQPPHRGAGPLEVGPRRGARPAPVLRPFQGFPMKRFLAAALILGLISSSASSAAARRSKTRSSTRARAAPRPRTKVKETGDNPPPARWRPREPAPKTP